MKQMIILCLLVSSLQAMDIEKKSKQKNGNQKQQLAQFKKADAHQKSEKMRNKNISSIVSAQTMPIEGQESDMQIDNEVQSVSTDFSYFNCEGLTAEQIWSVRFMIASMRELNQLKQNYPYNHS